MGKAERAQTGDEKGVRARHDTVRCDRSRLGERRKRKFGAWRDRIVVEEGFFGPLPKSELERWEGERAGG